MRNHRNFWDRNAGRYDRFMRKDRAAYEEMYALIRPVVKAKTVLELATGTGLIAKHIVNAAAHIEATDASAEMILEAKRDNRSAKLHFSVRDMFRLPYADKSFDVVIVSNALHIVPQPEKALDEIRRVLKDGGVLIAPTFTHAGNSFSGKARAFFQQPFHVRTAAAAAVQHPGVRRGIQKLKPPPRHGAVPDIHHGDHNFFRQSLRACGYFQRMTYHTSIFTHSA